jgi:hypothetical protein
MQTMSGVHPLFEVQRVMPQPSSTRLLHSSSTPFPQISAAKHVPPSVGTQTPP